MNQLESGEAPGAAHGRSDSQKELAEVLRQRAAISEVLRAIASSPHDLQPIFDTILDSGRRLSRADTGAFRLVEGAGFRLVAEVSPDVLEELPPPVVHGSFHDRLIASKSPFQIPDVAAHELYRAGDALAEALIKRGQRTLLLVPMLRNDEIIGSLSFGRQRVEQFSKKEIELVTLSGKPWHSKTRGPWPSSTTFRLMPLVLMILSLVLLMILLPISSE